MSKIQKSTSFILPKLGIPLTGLAENRFQTTYCRYIKHSIKDGGEYFYVVFSIGSPNLDELKKNEFYLEEFVDGNNIVVVFKFDEDFNFKVYKPFLLGKYSLIDRDYVESFFQKNRYDTIQKKGIESVNYSILNKDSRWKDWWESSLGVTLPEGAEVWSRPEKDEETYGEEIFSFDPIGGDMGKSTIELTSDRRRN